MHSCHTKYYMCAQMQGAYCFLVISGCVCAVPFVHCSINFRNTLCEHRVVPKCSLGFASTYIAATVLTSHTNATQKQKCDHLKIVARGKV